MMDLRLNRRKIILSTAISLASLRAVIASAQEQTSFTFAVLGLDFHTGGGSQRADTIMLSRVDLSTNTVRTLSIPRDLYVEVPGYGYAKINHGYQHGLEMDPELKWESGAQSAVATLTHNFGVAIDGVAVLEFEHMPKMIDAVGGLDIDNPYAISEGSYEFPAGMIHLNGDEATMFVRSRSLDGDGGRVMRQHLVLTSLLGKLQQPEMITRIPELIQQLNEVVRTDISPELQLRLIAAIPSIAPENLAFTNIEEFLWSDYTAGGAWIYRGDWSTLPQYVQSWLNGEIN